MEMIDYTGNLNNHEDYLKVLDKLLKKCKYIEIVIFGLDDNSNDIIKNFKDDIIYSKKVSKWWQTEASSKNNLYRINATKELFDFLRQYETFCKYYRYGTTEESLTRGDYHELTNFGFDDIAFYDEFDNYLLYTTTHEGYITISDCLIKE